MVKVGFLVVLLGAVAAGATATSGWLVEQPAEQTAADPPTEAPPTDSSTPNETTTTSDSASDSPSSGAAVAPSRPRVSGR